MEKWLLVAAYFATAWALFFIINSFIPGDGLALHRPSPLNRGSAMTNDSAGIKASGKGTIPCRDLARFFKEAAERDPFAKITVRVRWNGTVRSVTAEFPPGGGIDSGD